MRVIGLLPALSLSLGVAVGLVATWPRAFISTLALAVLIAVAAWVRRWPRVTTAALVVGFASGGAAIATRAADAALHPPLRQVLHDAFGGFAIDTLGPPGRHDPLPTRAVILDDASPRDGFVSLRVAVRDVRVGTDWHPAVGTVVLSISGLAPPDRVSTWTAGRTIEAPVTFRRPARYLDDGVPDFERDVALDGISLLGSVKSALLVEALKPGGRVAEAAARARAGVRRAIERWVGARNVTSGAITTAVLIGDRASIPDEVRERLQAAGTYHVIAISGGNIAIFVALVAALCALSGLGPRASSLVTIVPLTLYSAIVVSGPSVRRAVLVAAIYLVSRLFDHRTRAWQAVAVAASAMLVLWPLDVRDAAFELTFGAAGALLVLSERLVLPPSWPLAARWALGAMAASLAVEIALLPVQAAAFSRVTLAGVILNLIAVPAMTVVQVAGMATVALDVAHLPAGAAGAAADWAARLIVGSASQVDRVAALAPRVPPPHTAVIVAYYASLALALAGPRRARPIVAGATAAAALVMLLGARVSFTGGRDMAPGEARLTMLDVGQGDALVIEPPGKPPMLVDTGGSPFGSGLDVGRRVVAPALWARGIRSLSTLLITHGDPDHMGGAPGVLASLAVGEAWFGIRVPRHEPSNELLVDLAARHVGARYLRAGTTMDLAGMRLRVLHPPEPDWERQRVRNDDSVVLEIRYGDVAFLLLGDVSAEIERAIVPQLRPARVRVLKVAHHGSRTSTSQELLDAWRPQLALISAGRGNTFGHPARDVLERLESSGARVLRTDRNGEITVETNGHAVRWTTYRDVTQIARITMSRSIGTMATGDPTTTMSTMVAPTMVQPRSAAPAVRVRRRSISTPPVTWTTPVKMRNHWPSPICSKSWNHIRRGLPSNFPYPMKMNRTPTAMAGSVRATDQAMALDRDVPGDAVDSNMAVGCL
ncbi:MAG TPA: DNA internalization-related competence protein ComEC/Rec2 [Vicinamibacterales bacterium]|nr:DNA internalization-related competence protein ComEC/Rec2 [Vicinamibacterales bacterium]